VILRWYFSKIVLTRTAPLCKFTLASYWGKVMIRKFLILPCLIFSIIILGVLGLRLFATNDQIDFVSCESRNASLFAGRRWGKTFTSRNRILMKMQIPNFRYWFISPFSWQARKEYDGLNNHPEIQPLIRRSVASPYPSIYFHNGAEIHYRNFQRPQSLRGDGIQECWVDEIQDIDERDFWSVIRPLLSDRRGKLRLSGQFRGRNWVYRAFYERGLDQSISDFRTWVFATSSGLSFRCVDGRAEIEAVKSQMPRAIYDQEYDCLPGSNDRAVFRDDDLQSARRGMVISRGMQGRSYLISADLGKIVDPSAIVVFDIQAKTIVHENIRPLREKHDIGAKHLDRLSRDFGNATVVIDSTGGATGGKRPQDEVLKIYRRLLKDRLREFYWTMGNKERVINDLSVALEQGKLGVPKELDQVHNQLSLYEYTYRPSSNRYEYHGPDGHDDDLVAAVAQGWQGMLRRWGDNSGGGVSIDSVL